MTELARALAGTRTNLPRDLYDRACAAYGERWTLEAIGLGAHYTLVGVLIHGLAVAPRPADGPTF